MANVSPEKKIVKLDLLGKCALQNLMQLVYIKLLYQPDSEYGNIYLIRLENSRDQKK